MIIVIRVAANEGTKFYPQVFLDECLCSNKFYTLIELMSLKELMLLKQVHQKSAIFVTTVLFSIKGLSFNYMAVKNVMMYWWYLRTLWIFLFLILTVLIIAVLSTELVHILYILDIPYICQNEVVNLLQKSDLNKKCLKIVKNVSVYIKICKRILTFDEIKTG